MTPKKLRFSHKLALAMVLLMAVVILFSSTFRALVHPRVSVTRVNPGTIKLSYAQDDIRLDPDCLSHFALPLAASEMVSVQEILKSPGDRVYKGEAMLILNKEEAENAYFAAKQAYTAAKLALDDFDAGYEPALKAAKAALDAAQSAMNRLQFAAEDRRDSAEQALEKAQRAYDLLSIDGIWQHTTRDVLENDYRQAAERYEAWTNLRDHDYRMLAEERGTLISLSVALPCEYTILPDGREITLSVTAPNADFDGIAIGQEAKLITIPAVEEDQFVTVTEIKRIVPNTTLTFRFVPLVPSAFSAVGKYEISFDSSQYLALIPASALVDDDMIWIAEPVRNGSKTSYVANRMMIRRATGNALYIPCNDWLGDTLVITQWDKPLSVGKTVLLLDNDF
ncbi:MAG: hypothetical protein J1E43_01855 [Christensenellaceae bacterium]|nr:hypothetical protein [Christensenellaceae bacterium]